MKIKKQPAQPSRPPGDRNPRASVEHDIEQAIKAVVNTAKSYGVDDGLLLGFVNKEGLTTTHFQDMPASRAFNIIITMFNQLCDFELGNANASREHKEAIIELRTNFLLAINTFNKSL